MTIEVEIIITLMTAQTALLGGIFWRLGGLHSTVGNLKDRVTYIERELKEIKHV